MNSDILEENRGTWKVSRKTWEIRQNEKIEDKDSCNIRGKEGECTHHSRNGYACNKYFCPIVVI